MDRYGAEVNNRDAVPELAVASAIANLLPDLTFSMFYTT